MAKNLTQSDVQSLAGGLTPQELADQLGIGDKFRASQQQSQATLEAQSKLRKTKQEAEALSAKAAAARAEAKTAGLSNVQKSLWENPTTNVADTVKTQTAAQKDIEQAPAINRSQLLSGGFIKGAEAVGANAIDTAGSMITGLGQALITNPYIAEQTKNIDDDARKAWAVKTAHPQAQLTDDQVAALSKTMPDGRTMGEALDEIANLRQQQSDKQNSNLLDQGTSSIISNAIEPTAVDKISRGVHGLMEGDGSFTDNLGNVLSGAVDAAGSLASAAWDHPTAAMSQLGSTVAYMGAVATGPAGAGAAFLGDTGTNTTQNILQAGDKYAQGEQNLTDAEKAALVSTQGQSKATVAGAAAAGVALTSEGFSRLLGKATGGAVGRLLQKESKTAALGEIAGTTEQKAAALTAKKGAALGQATSGGAERSAIEAEQAAHQQVAASLHDKVVNNIATPDELTAYQDAINGLQTTSKSLRDFDAARVSQAKSAMDASKQLDQADYEKLIKANQADVKAHNDGLKQQIAANQARIKDIQADPSKYQNPSDLIAQLEDSSKQLKSQFRTAPTKFDAYAGMAKRAAAKTVANTALEAGQETVEEGTEDVLGQYGSGQKYNIEQTIKAAGLGGLGGAIGGHAIHVAGLGTIQATKAVGKAIDTISTAAKSKKPNAVVDAIQSNADLDKAHADVQQTDLAAKAEAFKAANPNSTLQDFAANHMADIQTIQDSKNTAVASFQAIHQRMSELQEKWAKQGQAPTQEESNEYKTLEHHATQAMRAFNATKVVDHVVSNYAQMGTGQVPAFSYGSHDFSKAVDDYANAKTDAERTEAAMTMQGAAEHNGLEGVTEAQFDKALKAAPNAAARNMILGSHATAIAAEGARIVKGMDPTAVSADVKKQLQSRIEKYKTAVSTGDLDGAKKAADAVGLHYQHQVNKLSALHDLIAANDAWHADANPQTEQALREADQEWKNAFTDPNAAVHNKQWDSHKPGGLSGIEKKLSKEVEGLGNVYNHMNHSLDLKAKAQQAPAQEAQATHEQASQEPATQQKTSESANAPKSSSTVREALRQADTNYASRFETHPVVGEHNTAKLGRTMVPALTKLFLHNVGKMLAGNPSLEEAAKQFTGDRGAIAKALQGFLARKGIHLSEQALVPYLQRALAAAAQNGELDERGFMKSRSIYLSGLAHDYRVRNNRENPDNRKAIQGIDKLHQAVAAEMGIDVNQIFTEADAHDVQAILGQEPVNTSRRKEAAPEVQEEVVAETPEAKAAPEAINTVTQIDDAPVVEAIQSTTVEPVMDQGVVNEEATVEAEPMIDTDEAPTQVQAHTNQDYGSRISTKATEDEREQFKQAEGKSPEETSKLLTKLQDAAHALNRSLALIKEAVATGNTARLLVGVLPQQFTSNLKHFTLKARENRSALGRDPRLMQKLQGSQAIAVLRQLFDNPTGDMSKVLQMNKQYIAYRNYLAKHIQAVLTNKSDKGHRRASASAYQDWFAEFVEDGPNGEPVINEQLMDALAAGAFMAMKREAGNALYQTPLDIAKSLQLTHVDADGKVTTYGANSDESEVTLPNEVLQVLSRAGLPVNSFRTLAGQLAYSALGMSVVANGQAGAQDKMIEAFGHVIHKALESAGAVSEGINFHHENFVGENQLANQLREAGYEVGVKQATFINFSVQGETGWEVNSTLKDMIQLDADAGAYADKLFVPSYERKSAVTSPEEVVYTNNERIGKTQQTVAPAVIDIYKKASASPYTVGSPAISFGVLDDETQLAIAGAPTQEAIDNSIKGLKPTLEGQRSTYINDIASMNKALGILKAATTKAGSLASKLYVKMVCWGNGRYGIDSDFNPVSTKLHRNMFPKANWATTVDTNNPAHVKEFMLTVAEGLDITADKYLPEDRMRMVEEKLAKPEIRAGIDGLKAILKAVGSHDGSQSHADFIAQRRNAEPVKDAVALHGSAIAAAVKAGEGGTHSYAVLEAMAQFELAQENGTNKFTHQLYEEVDGVTNGMSFILTHYTNIDAHAYAFNQRVLANGSATEAQRAEAEQEIEEANKKLFDGLARVGVFKTGQSYTEWKNSAGEKDTYEAFAAAINARFNANQKMLEDLTSIYKQAASPKAASQAVDAYFQANPDAASIAQLILGLDKDEKLNVSAAGVEHHLAQMLAVKHFTNTKNKATGELEIARNGVKPLVMIAGYGAGDTSAYRTFISQVLVPNFYKDMQKLQDIAVNPSGFTLDQTQAVVARANESIRQFNVLIHQSSAKNEKSLATLDFKIPEISVDDVLNGKPISVPLINGRNKDGSQAGAYVPLSELEVTSKHLNQILKNARGAHKAAIVDAKAANYGDAFRHRDGIVGAVNAFAGAMGVVVAHRFQEARTEFAQQAVNKHYLAQAKNEEFIDDLNFVADTNFTTDTFNDFAKAFTKTVGNVAIDGNQAFAGMYDNFKSYGFTPESWKKFVGVYKKHIADQAKMADLTKQQEKQVLGECLDLLPGFHNHLTQSDKDATVNKWHKMLLTKQLERVEGVTDTNNTGLSVRSRFKDGMVSSNVAQGGLYTANGAATNVLPVHHTDALIQLMMQDMNPDMINVHDAIIHTHTGLLGMTSNSQNAVYEHVMREENVAKKLMDIVDDMAKQLLEDADNVGPNNRTRSVAQRFYNAMTVANGVADAATHAAHRTAINAVMKSAFDGMRTDDESTAALLTTAKSFMDVDQYGDAAEYVLKVLAGFYDTAWSNYNEVVNGHEMIRQNTAAVNQYALSELTHYTDPKATTTVVQRPNLYGVSAGSTVVVPNLREASNSAEAIDANNALGSHAFSQGRFQETGRVDINNAEDVVSTFNSLANVGIVKDSAEHQQYLSEIAGDLIGKVIQPLVAVFGNATSVTSYGQSRAGQILVANAVSPSKIPTWIRGKLRMSSQEVYVHELLHAITQHGIENMPGAAQALDRLRKHCKSELENNPEFAELYADNKEMFDRVFYPTPRADGFTDHNHEFVAYGMSNAVMVQFLKQVSAPSNKVKDMFKGETAFEKVAYFLSKSTEFLSKKLRGLSTDSAYAQLHDIVLRVTGIQEQHESAVRKIAGKLEGIAPLDFATKQFRSALDGIANNLPGESRVAKAVRGSFAAASLFFNPDKYDHKGNPLIKLVGEKSTRLLNHVQDKWGAFGADLAQNIYGMKGTTEKTEGLIRLQRLATQKVDHARQQIQAAVVKAINNTFDPATQLDASEKHALHLAFHRADVSALLNVGHTIGEITGYLTDPMKLKGAISDYEQKLSGDKHSNFWKVQAENLGHYQIHEESFLELPRMNAYAIAKGSDMSGSADGVTVHNIDALVSLHALAAMSDSQREKVANIILHETARGEVNGISSTIGMVLDLKKKQSAQAGFNKFAAPKLISSDKYDPRVAVKASTNPNDKTLTELGYTVGHVVPADPATGAKTTYVYVHHHGGHSVTQEAAMKFFRHGSKDIQVDLNEEMVDTLQARRAKLGKDQRHYASGSLQKAKPVSTIPQYGPTGVITGYARVLNAAVKNNLLMRENHFDETLANSHGLMDVLPAQRESNRAVIQELRDMYDTQYADNPNDFIQVHMKSDNPEIRSYAARMNPEDWEDVHELFGDKFMVRRDVAANVFGMQKYSTQEIWQKDPKVRNFMERQIHGIMTKLYGNQAANKLNAAVDKWQALVSLAKDRVVIAGVSNSIENMNSNITMLKSEGIPMSDILSGHVEAANELLKYSKVQRRLAELDQLVKGFGISTQKRKAYDVERANLMEYMRTTPIKDLVDEGFMEGIEELTGDETSSAVEKIETLQKLHEQFQKVPVQGRRAIEEALLTKNSKTYAFLKDFAAMGDFAARYVMVKHMTTRKQNRMTKEAAVAKAADYFIYYATPNGKFTQLADDMGLAPFIKYGLRVQKHIVNSIRQRPLHSAAVIGASAMLGSSIGIFGSVLTPLALLGKIRFPLQTLSMLAQGFTTKTALNIL